MQGIKNAIACICLKIVVPLYVKINDMPEILLHYIWQQRLWAECEQFTTDGIPVEIISTGQHNRDAGPDFSHVHLRIGQQEWVGNVELHVRASDWKRHRHHTDPAYDSVILHVVCQADETVYNSRGEAMAQCVLRYPQAQDYLSRMLTQAQQMDSAFAMIPCSQSLLQMPSLLTQGWRSALLLERWRCKVESISRLLEITQHSWAHAFYITLAHNFGFHTNSLPFESLALQTPLSCLQKHRNSLFQVTAILLGQSGLLSAETAVTSEQQRLLAEYHFLQKKFSLQPLAPKIWKRARLRPQNAPEVRIRQFAQLLCQSEFLFSQVLNAQTIEDLRNLLRLAPVDSSAISLPPAIGKSSVDVLLINTLLPYKYAYAKEQQDHRGMELALALMTQLPPEDNTIIRQWRMLGQEVLSAADTQALIHLYQHYCQHERCIHCEVGSLVFGNVSFVG